MTLIGGKSSEQHVLFFMWLVINQDCKTFGAEDVFCLILSTLFCSPELSSVVRSVRIGLYT